MKDLMKFINALADNNNKAWMDENREWYLESKAKFYELTEKLIVGVEALDPMVHNLTVKDCTYRINKDIRFAHDKRPYKTHMGAYMCPFGKKSGYAGYYFHLESHLNDYIGRSMLAAGAYCLNPKTLDSVRNEIYDYPEKFLEELDASGFQLMDNEQLKKAPKGYPADFKYVDLLKYKSYSIGLPMNEDILYSDHLIDWVLEKFSHTVPFNTFLNRAIDYAVHEEDEQL